MSHNRTSEEINTREMVRQECERRNIGSLTRWMIDRPRLLLAGFRLLWLPYVVTGNRAEWQSNCDILRVLITCEPDKPRLSSHPFLRHAPSKRGELRRRARLKRRARKAQARALASESVGMAPITAPIAPQPWIARVWRSLRRSHVATTAPTVTRQQNEGR